MADKDDSNLNNKKRYKVEFDKKETINNVMEMVSYNNLEVLGIKHEYKIGDRVISGGYVFDSRESFKNQIKKYEIAHKDFIKQRMEILTEKNKEKIYEKEQIQEELDYYSLQESNIYEISIVEIDVAINENEIEKLKNYDIEIKEVSENARLTSYVPNNTYRDNDTWIPDSGYIKVERVPNSSPEERSIYLDFRWDSDYDLSGFHVTGDDNETLEMDIWFENDNGEAYLKTNSGAYWSSDQPKPYLDTQAFDDFKPSIWCVGCADAQLFKPNTTYYWYARGSYNGVRGEGGRTAIVPQRGYRLPANVYSAWSVFSEQTEANDPPLGYSKFSTPGSRNWSKDY